MIPKYRVWDKKEQKWVSANIIVTSGGLLCWTFGDTHELVDDRERYDVQLSTGLKDRKGKEIFEGDVVKVHASETKGTNWMEVIEWRCDPNGDIGEGNNYWTTSKSEGWCPDELEVIGNVWENPELLEASKP